MSAHAPAASPVELDESILATVREDLAAVPGPVDVPRVARVLRDRGQVFGAATMLEVTARIRDHVAGLGPLQHLAVPGVSDLLLNGDGSVWVDDGQGLHRTDVHVAQDEARDLAVRLATLGGRRLDDAMPFADARLPGGIRFHGLLPPLSPSGTLISLRLRPPVPLDLDDLRRAGSFDADLEPVLRALISSRTAFLVTGGTGTGKTTLLGSLLALVPRTDRIVVVEDAQELSVTHPHVVHLQSRHPNNEGTGEVDLSTLVRQCLRMRPDRIVLGECRGAEVRDLLQALNTGHEGGCGTVHANTAADVPARLEALGALGGLGPRTLAAQVASALEVVIHLGREGASRCIEQISLLGRDGNGLLTTSPALDLRPGAPREGPGLPRLLARLGLEVGQKDSVPAHAAPVPPHGSGEQTTHPASHGRRRAKEAQRS
jgi:pilus assembly protein CpaF